MEIEISEKFIGERGRVNCSLQEKANLDNQSIVWIKDLGYTIGKLDDNFQKSINEFENKNEKNNSKDFFINGEIFFNKLKELKTIELENPHTKSEIIIEANCDPQIHFNKKIDLLKFLHLK